MSDGILSIGYGVRVLAFADVYVVLQALLELIRMGQVSLLSTLSHFIAGILLAFVLSLTLFHLPLKKLARFGLLWVVLFVVQEFSNLLEGLFFTTFLSTVWLFLVANLIGALVTFIEAASATMLFLPKESGESFVAVMREYAKQKSWVGWVLRIIVSSLVYFPIYFAFGALISPFVIPYYLDPSLGLRIPSFAVMIPLEFVRGFLYVLVLMPILATLKVGKKYVCAAAVSLLYVAGAFVPFLASSMLPVQLRIFHGFEILGDCVVYGSALVYLLGRKAS